MDNTGFNLIYSVSIKQQRLSEHAAKELLRFAYRKLQASGQQRTVAARTVKLVPISNGILPRKLPQTKVLLVIIITAWTTCGNIT